MVKRCKDCPGSNEVKSIVEPIEEVKIESMDVPTEGEGVNKNKKYCFPKYGIQVRAKNLEEAYNELQRILTSNEK